MQDEVPQWGEEMERQLRADITSRLRGVCREWTDDDFHDVVDKIVRISAKYFYRPFDEPKPPTGS